MQSDTCIAEVNKIEDCSMVKTMDKGAAYPYVRFNANMTGALIAEDVCREQKAVGKLPANGAICNAMEEVYRKYGYYFEGAFGITLNGVDGAAQIKEMMENFRNHPLETFAGIKVTGMRDYVSGIRKPLDGEEEHMGLPKSNVLYYELENRDQGLVAEIPFCV